MRNFIHGVSLILRFFILIALISCEQERPALFQVTVTDAVLYAASAAAQKGSIDFSSPLKLDYQFKLQTTEGAQEAFVTRNTSLVIEYDFNNLPSAAIKDKYSLVVSIEAALLDRYTSWKLPMEFNSVKYAVPIDDSFNGQFSIFLEPIDVTNETGKMGKISGIDKNTAPVFTINSIALTEMQYGFKLNDGKYLFLSPFLSVNNDNFTIDVPNLYLPNRQLLEIEAGFSSSQTILEFSKNKFEVYPGVNNFYIPPSLYSVSDKIILSGGEIDYFLLREKQPTGFPKPIKADPLMILDWPKEKWRYAKYEIFKWDRFPSILIFDFADYDIQNKMLKRLAFFVEKEGFRGRLSYDRETSRLYAWNAHDYRAEDLARFFDLAHKTEFPLLDEEWELEKILLNEGIIRKTNDGITSGEGAIATISRASPDYLRYRFMAHECFHGLFFLNEDFRDFARDRWQHLDTEAKNFLKTYFTYFMRQSGNNPGYDISDEYLLVNEFMAYCLQQSVSQASDYFGRHTPNQVDYIWRNIAKSQKNETTGTWPVIAKAFAAEAQAFSDYVNQRWGLAAGRVWGIRIK